MYSGEQIKQNVQAGPFSGESVQVYGGKAIWGMSFC